MVFLEELLAADRFGGAGHLILKASRSPGPKGLLLGAAAHLHSDLWLSFLCLCHRCALACEECFISA